MKVIPYNDKYKDNFINLNKGWIERFFKIEDNDLYCFSHINDYIKNGGMIYFAIDNDVVLATALVQNHGDGLYEIGKFAALNQSTNTGAGSAVFKECIEFVKKQKGKRIKLISNTKLDQALHIYKKFGFIETRTIDNYEGYARGDIELELVL